MTSGVTKRYFKVSSMPPCALGACCFRDLICLFCQLLYCIAQGFMAVARLRKSY